jgi:hypothetical protein
MRQNKTRIQVRDDFITENMLLFGVVLHMTIIQDQGNEGLHIQKSPDNSHQVTEKRMKIKGSSPCHSPFAIIILATTLTQLLLTCTSKAVAFKSYFI